MKVLAKTENDFLVQATCEELVALTNKKITVRDNSSYYGHDTIKVGTEFNISAAWSQIHRNERRKAEVLAAKKMLESVISQLEMVEPFLKEPDPQQ